MASRVIKRTAYREVKEERLPRLLKVQEKEESSQGASSLALPTFCSTYQFNQ